jgi:hypothetical protein
VQSLTHGEGEDLATGDVERLVIEWKSLLDLVVHAPSLGIGRWQELQVMAKKLGGGQAQASELPVLPELPVRQRRRFEGPLRRS